MEEESNLAKDLLGGMRSLIKERLVSPLLPAFILSWLIWNYRVILTILSDEDLETKFSVIEKMFPTFWIHCLDGVLVPLSFSLAYIYLYPLASIPVYRFALVNQRKLREERQKAENEKLLSEEDKQKILAFAYDQKISSQKQVDQQVQEIEQLRAKITELEKPQRQNKEARGMVQKPTPDSKTEDLAEDKFKVLAALSFAENKGIEKTEEKDLKKIITDNVTELKIVLEELERANLLQKGFNSNGPTYAITHEGRKAYKKRENDLLEKSNSFSVKRNGSLVQTENDLKSRLLLTPEQLMDNRIRDFLQNDPLFDGMKFIVFVKDGKITVSKIPSDLSGKAQNFDYEFIAANEINIWNEIERIKVLIRRDLKPIG